MLTNKLTLVLSLCLFAGQVEAFTVVRPIAGRTLLALKASRVENSASTSFLLQDFTDSKGVLVEPYETLQVSRTAGRQEIKQAYRDLSRKYHPDAFRMKTSFKNLSILPGKCNSLEDVRDQWERIKLSYEILSDTKMRKRYDRHTTLADPGKAMQRAALGAVGDGLKGLGQGLFNMGAFAVEQLTKDEPVNEWSVEEEQLTKDEPVDDRPVEE